MELFDDPPNKWKAGTLHGDKFDVERNLWFLARRLVPLPVLKDKCFKCHGGEKVRAEFVMTNREDLIAGGESGEAVDLESPLDSLLLSVETRLFPHLHPPHLFALSIPL